MMSESNPQAGVPDQTIVAVSPALATFTRQAIDEDLWHRSELSTRDRSIVTIAALIARHQNIGFPRYFNRALDAGLSAAELSEIMTHLAFYSGWPNAMAAVAVLDGIFSERGVEAGQLPEAAPALLPLDEAAELSRSSAVQQNFGDVAPGVVQYTTDLLFRNLWLRPGLTPRDRSLVTVSALIASGHIAQITYHLNRAMDNGLTREQASEVLTHLAFYEGWPNIFSAMPVVKQVFESRQ